MASFGKKKKSAPRNSPLKDKKLEVVVAALLLTGKLKVDSVQLYRNASTVISLVGQFKTIGGLNNSNIESMVNFLNKNGNMTLDEVVEAFRIKTGNG
ncbi:hypothetical protein [Paenibacillus senegalensis]|uniref:hypothetical protein n=1 Tax=Paenibacillus senegalensis TaxID=1465766 RepID=UPI00028A3B62|nr:hypothetical protein [Paenibacillus senegalensis]